MKNYVEELEGKSKKITQKGKQNTEGKQKRKK